MKILCIGNSFSQDACCYLHDMAQHTGAEIDTLNLFIGGCSLETHIYNLFFNKPYYKMEYNGTIKDENKMGSIQEALTQQDWDYISIQQVSYLSGKYESYQPHLNRIISRVRDVRPNSKILIHQTWAYDPQHPKFPELYNDCNDMYEKLTEAYSKAAEAIGAYMIIPCGEVIQKLRYLPQFDSQKGGAPLHRDLFHLSEVYGRYAAAATWYEKLLGNVKSCGFIPEGADPELIEIIKQTVYEICKI